MRRIVLAFLILISSVSFAFADTIFLRDGRQIRGTLLGFVNGRFVVRVENASSTAGANVDRNRRDSNDLQYFRPEEVDRIEIEGR
jgi:hypothetical protein